MDSTLQGNTTGTIRHYDHSLQRKTIKINHLVQGKINQIFAAPDENTKRDLGRQLFCELEELGVELFQFANTLLTLAGAAKLEAASMTFANLFTELVERVQPQINEAEALRNQQLLEGSNFQPDGEKKLEVTET